MILEEFQKPDAVLLNDVLDFSNECVHVTVDSCEIGELFIISGFGTSCWAINDVLEAVGIIQELLIHDLVILVSVDLGNIHSISISQCKAESCQNLTEHLGAHFEVSVAIKVLEEALCIQSVLPDKLHELASNALYICNLVFSCTCSAISDV